MIRRRINIQSQLDAVNQAAAQALASAQSAVSVSQGQATARPSIRPVFAVDFANSRLWDPRLSFSRSGGDIATYIDKLGVLRTAKGNQPRFTHDPVTKKCLGLLREESRANLFVQSNNFSHSSWLKNRASIITDANVLSPDGQSAQKLVEDTTANASHQLGRGDIVVTVGQRYSASIALMYADKRYVQVQLAGAAIYGGSNPAANVDLLTGTITQTFNCESATIERTALGYYIVTVTQTVSVAGNTGMNVMLMSDANTLIYTGDGVSGVYVFNGQIELGAFSTSPIVNTTTVQTRGADAINLTGTNFQKAVGNLSEFTVLYSALKAKVRNTFTDYYRIAGDDTAGGNNYCKLTDHQNSPRIYPEVMKNGVQTYSYMNVNNAPFGSFFSHAIAVSATNTKSFVNNTADFSDNDVQVPSNLNRIDLSGGVTTIIAHFAIWNSRLTDAETQALTTTGLSGKNPNQIPTIADINRSAFVAPESLLCSISRQHFTVDGAGASITRNIRFNFDFDFEIVDSSGCSITSQPSASCLANTDNALVFSAPLGKSLTYAVTPKFEY